MTVLSSSDKYKNIRKNTGILNKLNYRMRPTILL